MPESFESLRKGQAAELCCAPLTQNREPLRVGISEGGSEEQALDFLRLWANFIRTSTAVHIYRGYGTNLWFWGITARWEISITPS